MLNKKAAMFGLDARIALAIFGALSVISGAALYSAIQDAKITALLADFQEINKGIESYYIDTGLDLEQFKLADLVSSTQSGWKGPYVNYPTNPLDTNQLLYKNLPTTVMYVTRYSDDPFVNSATQVLCSSSNNCYSWLAFAEKIADDEVQETWRKLSERVDGNTDLLTGKVRMLVHSTYRYFYIQAMPVQEQI
tara:strand:- start:95 stop:673 length:579 start_codon:yes stop_codon:yes gene_type:complete